MNDRPMFKKGGGVHMVDWPKQKKGRPNKLGSLKHCPACMQCNDWKRAHCPRSKEHSLCMKHRQEQWAIERKARLQRKPPDVEKYIERTMESVEKISEDGV